MLSSSLLLLSLTWILGIQSKCIWYEGIRDGLNQVYPNGEPKPLPLPDLSLLNEMCPHIPTRQGISPPLCCDRKQLLEMQKFKYILDNVIGRCPSCYFNLLRIFCEMACSPEQDQFIWPLEMMNMTRPNEGDARLPDSNPAESRAEFDALPDYVDPEEEEPEQQPIEVKNLVPAKPVETVQVISKIRYFISEKQANAFIDSCW